MFWSGSRGGPEGEVCSCKAKGSGSSSCRMSVTGLAPAQSGRLSGQARAVARDQPTGLSQNARWLPNSLEALLARRDATSALPIGLNQSQPTWRSARGNYCESQTNSQTSPRAATCSAHPRGLPLQRAAVSDLSQSCKKEPLPPLGASIPLKV